MTIDDIFAALPDEPAQDSHEFLVIDPTTRTIQVPANESIFGVEGDEDGERKYFISPRYVGDHVDLAACFLSIVYRNANGEPDQYLVTDAAVNGEYVTFSWLLSEKVVKYKGAVQFRFDADTAAGPAWGTTMAQGESLEGMEPEIDTVEEQTSDVVTQLRAMVTTQTAAVEAAGAAQVAAVKAQGTASIQEAVAAIQAQGAATNASIPAEYTELEATVDRLTRDRAAAIVCQAEGTAIQVQDASSDPLQGLRIFGRSTQDGTPTPDNPVEIVSTPAPVVQVCGKNLAKSNRDGVITSAGITVTQTKNYSEFVVSGTAANATSITVLRGIPLANGRHVISVYGLNIIDAVYDRLYITDSAGTLLANYVRTGEPVAFEVAEHTSVDVTVIFSENSTYNNSTVSVQIERGDNATAYEPYTGQALAITTPGSLPGIPVASGGNYTDENGQQWIADEVDLARGVYVQRILRKTISDFSKAVAAEPTSGHTEGYINNGVHSREKTGGLCDHFHYAASGHFERFGLAGAMVYFTLSGELTADEWRERMTALSPTIFVALKDPTETPLSDVELQAYLAMHSKKPTTTVLNDAGAHMVLEYAADPKTFICNQIAAAIAAK